MGISVEGAIVLIRYGALVRSEKVIEAERRGAIGAILYSDPAQYASSSKNIVSCSFFFILIQLFIYSHRRMIKVK